ncbi:MAG: glycosyltransferase [Crocinitomicaceae bacterium]
MAKREILILSSWYPTKEQPFLGNFVVRNAQLLSEAHNITLVNTIPSDSATELSLKENNTQGYREIQVTHPRGGNLYSKKRWQKKALKRTFLETDNFDLIIGHVLLPKALQFVVTKNNFNAPLILIEHGSYYRPEFRHKWNRLHEFILQYTRKHFNEVVAVSPFLKQDMKADFPQHEINVIGNHIDTEMFSPGKEKSNSHTAFLHISTLDPSTKNPQGIIDACELLKQTENNFHLTIICDEDYSAWQKEVVSKGLSEHISFEGPIAPQHLVSFYQKADAFVLNSSYESFSIVLAEAWSTGLPVISTSVGIAHEIGPTLGIQTEQNNPKSLKIAMKAMMENKTNYSQDLLREKAMQYSELVILEQWIQLINKHVK